MNRERRHILFIVPLPPPVHGSTVVSRQIRESERINALFDCDFINLSTSRSIQEIDKFRPQKILRFLGALCKTGWKLATRRYDLCYLAITCHGRGFLKDFPFVILCKLFGRKVVLHQHNKGMARDLDRRGYRKLLSLAYNKSKVILLSKYLYPDIAGIVPESQVLICPNGIPDCTVAKRTRDQGRVELLFISNLIESKGVLDLIAACRVLMNDGKDFYCRIIGNESVEITRTTLKDLIRKEGLEKYVHYEGARYGDEKEHALQTADLFVFPTYDDCFPLCILEAMQHALPVITTDEGGIPDMVQDGVNGLICNKRDPESLSRAIAELMDQPERRLNMGQKGRRAYESSFTPAHFERNLIECLEKSME